MLPPAITLRICSGALLLAPLACEKNDGPATVAPEPSEPVATADVDSPTPEAEPSAEEPPAELGTHEFVWGNSEGEWNSGVAIAPSGWVLAAGHRKISVHASDDGRVLESAEPCSVADNGVWLASDERGAIACRDGQVVELVLPGLGLRGVGNVGGTIEEVAWSKGVAAFGRDDGQVVVVDTTAWKPMAQFSVPGEVEAVAISRDGQQIAASVDEQGIFVFSRGRDGGTTQLTKDDTRPDALAFSPDGTLLIAQDGSFEARVYEVATGKIVDLHKCGSWLTGAVWLDDTTVAVSGSDGFLVYRHGERNGEPLVDPEAREYRTGVWLDATPDGATVCGGDRDGRLSCFSTGPMPASTYKPAPPPAKTATAPLDGPPREKADPPSSPATESVYGTIKGRKGKNVRVEVTKAMVLPDTGVTGTLSRKFERKLGRMSMEGWMEIARVKVVAVKGKTVTLQILEETANVVINGKKQQQFKSGFEVHFEY